MLKSVETIRELNKSCETLLYWQKEKETGNKLAIKEIPIWIDIVTKLTSKAKIEVTKLNVDRFIQHSLELLEYKIDTTYIHQISLVASKPDYTTYNKLLTQLKMFQACNNYAMKEASSLAETLIETRLLMNKFSSIETLIRSEAKETNIKLPETGKGFEKVTGNYMTNDLLKVARKVLPEINRENNHRIIGIRNRAIRDTNKANLKQADKFLRGLIETLEAPQVVTASTWEQETNK